MDVGASGGNPTDRNIPVRFFSAARPQPSTLTAISSGLRELYTVPNDVPESFVKAFARLELCTLQSTAQYTKIGFFAQGANLTSHREH